MPNEWMRDKRFLQNSKDAIADSIKHLNQFRESTARHNDMVRRSEALIEESLRSRPP